MFCRLFDKRFYNNNFIFVRPGVSTTFIDIGNPVIAGYYIKDKNLEEITKSILNSFSFNKNYENIDRDAQRLAKQLIKQTNFLEGQSCEIQVISSPFFRRKASYLIGKIVSHNNTSHPLLIAILNDEKTGLYVDALLTNVSSISMIFSFSRSYFLSTPTTLLRLLILENQSYLLKLKQICTAQLACTNMVRLCFIEHF